LKYFVLFLSMVVDNKNGFFVEMPKVKFQYLPKGTNSKILLK
jgi:hypothetical protein